MSAIRKEYKDVGESTVFHFEQDVPVPSYLIAIAIGVLEARRVGPRSHVWAEKEVLTIQNLDLLFYRHFCVYRWLKQQLLNLLIRKNS